MLALVAIAAAFAEPCPVHDLLQARAMELSPEFLETVAKRVAAPCEITSAEVGRLLGAGVDPTLLRQMTADRHPTPGELAGEIESPGLAAGEGAVPVAPTAAASAAPAPSLGSPELVSLVGSTVVLSGVEGESWAGRVQAVTARDVILVDRDEQPIVIPRERVAGVAWRRSFAAASLDEAARAERARKEAESRYQEEIDEARRAQQEYAVAARNAAIARCRAGHGPASDAVTGGVTLMVVGQVPLAAVEIVNVTDPPVSDGWFIAAAVVGSILQVGGIGIMIDGSRAHGDADRCEARAKEEDP
jgi:hypothetical protein